MKILVDADSCPKAARELVLRRAAKMDIKVIFAANRPIPVTEGVVMEICSSHENSADDRIVELAENNDIAITRDVPLAKRLVEKNVYVIDDRGRVFTSNNINELLSLRNFTVGLAENGIEIVRIANYSKKDFKTFADSFDRLLTKLK
ncbi:MAG: DUF188 domain-containing protein [Treponema sp.]|nr:DUF188 domain-containing protein [Treponema sp.]